MMYYFLFANTASVLFYMLYSITIKGRKNHVWSRFYLLSGIALSFIIPLLKLKLLFLGEGNILALKQTIQLPDFVLNNAGQSNSDILQHSFSWMNAYLLLTSFLFIQLVYRVIKMKVFLKNQSFIQNGNYKIGMNTGMGPASFGAIIIFPGNEIDPNILQHEIAHLQLKHHYEKVVLQLLRCFFYPVLAFHLMYKELMIVHEFEADERAALDKEIYSKLLLSGHFNNKQLHLLQSFFHHPLKRRIKMLYKNKTSSKGTIASLLSLSLLLISGLITIQSCAKDHSEKTGKSVVTVQPYNKKQPEKVYSTADIEPEFEGGASALQKYLEDNIHYPESAKIQKIEGRAIIQFIVTKTGSIDSVVIKRDVDGSGFGAEATRAIQAMPKWKPGSTKGEPVSVQYILPVNFQLPK